MKKYTILRKQTLTLASVVLGTVFTGTTIASADDVAPATTQATPATLPKNWKKLSLLFRERRFSFMVVHQGHHFLEGHRQVLLRLQA